MPIYEYRCECGNEFEAVVSVADRDDIECECGGETKRLMATGVNAIGAIWDKKIHIGGLDRTFNTNAEMRQYLKENPSIEFVSTKDAAWKNSLQKATDKADSNARKWGFRSKRHWSDVQKREAAKGGGWTTA